MLDEELKQELIHNLSPDNVTCSANASPLDHIATSDISDNDSKVSEDECFSDHSTISEPRFQNMISAQRFRNWLGYEWLYSPIDREIFLGTNDFQVILREQFPHIKRHRLIRGQWAIIRRMIGRPRRFSTTFLDEERDSVRGKRRNLRYLQHVASTGSLGPISSEHLETLLNCLPLRTRIPVRLPIGTKVCVRLYSPVHYLAVGVVQDMCPCDGHYGVWIENVVSSENISADSSEHTNPAKSNIHSFRIISDEDVFTLPGQHVPQSIPLSSLRCCKENIIDNPYRTMAGDTNNYHMVTPFTGKRSPDMGTNRKDGNIGEVVSHSIGYPLPDPISTSGDPVLNENICSSDYRTGDNTHSSSHQVTGYSLDASSSELLDPQTEAKLFTSLSKLFNLVEQKRKTVETLRQMNDTAETKLSENTEDLTVQFQHTYATLILHLDKLNRELRDHMNVVIAYVTVIAQEQNMLNLTSITDWRRRCDDEAQEMITRIRLSQNTVTLDECKLALVSKLSCLVIHLCNLSDQRFLSQSLVCIEDLLRDIRCYLHPNNYECFQTTVERYISLIIQAITNTIQPRYTTVEQPTPMGNMYSTENMSSV